MIQGQVRAEEPLSDREIARILRQKSSYRTTPDQIAKSKYRGRYRGRLGQAIKKAERKLRLLREIEAEGEDRQKPGRRRMAKYRHGGDRMSPDWRKRSIRQEADHGGA